MIDVARAITELSPAPVPIWAVVIVLRGRGETSGFLQCVRWLMNLLKGLDGKLVRLVVGPIVRRMGTAIAVYLVSKGLPEDQVEQLLVALGAVIGLAFDIGLAAISRRKVEQKGFSSGVSFANTAYTYEHDSVWSDLPKTLNPLLALQRDADVR